MPTENQILTEIKHSSCCFNLPKAGQSLPAKTTPHFTDVQNRARRKFQPDGPIQWKKAGNLAWKYCVVGMKGNSSVNEATRSVKQRYLNVTKLPAPSGNETRKGGERAGQRRWQRLPAIEAVLDEESDCHHELEDADCEVDAAQRFVRPADPVRRRQRNPLVPAEDAHRVG